MYLRVAAAQLDTVVGDLDGNVDRIVAALAPGRGGRAPTCASSPSWPSPATRPRTCCSSRASWPTTWPRWTRWPRPPATAWPWSGSSSRWVPTIGPPGPDAEAWAGRRRATAGPSGQRGRGVCRRPRASASTASACCPTTACSTSSGGSPRAGGRRPSTGVRGVPGRGVDLRGRLVRRGPGGGAGPRPGPSWWSTSTPRPTRGAAGPSGWPCCGDRVAEAGCAIAYVNQVGGQDELVFDGASLVVGGRRHAAGGRRPVRTRTWWWSTCAVPPSRPALARPAVGPGGRRSRSAAGPAGGRPLAPAAALSRSSRRPRSTRRWCSGPATTWPRTASPMPSSGCRAASTRRWWRPSPSTPSGPGSVHGLSMPSRYSSEGSLTDAAALAERLGIDLREVPIEPAHVALAGAAGAGARRPAAGPDRREPPVAGSAACC